MADDTRSSRRRFLRNIAFTGAGVTLAGCGPAGESGTATAEPVPEAGPHEGATPALAKVPRRKLGATGLDVPILSMGGGQTFDRRYDRILHRGFREGIDFLDTALRYSEGMSHRTLAPFVRQVGRENLILLSKGYTERATVASFSRDLDVCRRELDTDYLDLFFMQAVDDPRFLEPEFIRMGETFRREGRIRFFGFSTCGHGMIECMEKAARVGGIDAIMFRYSFARYGDLALNRAIDACKQAGIGLVAMKSQNCVPADHEHVKAFRSQQFNLAQAKLKAVWADERIDSVTSLMDNTTKLAENVAAAKTAAPLAMAEYQQLRGIAVASAHLSCQGCAEICEPLCAGRVQVARPLRYLMYHECYGETVRARERYAELEPEARSSEGVDFAAASRACPQGIDIAARLGEARRALG
jgi:predicted aldo/keto reductase-like oxidoreductase